MIFDRVLRAAVMRLDPFAIQAGFDLRRDFFPLTAQQHYRQDQFAVSPTRHRQVFSFLMMGIGLVAKRIEIIPSTTPLMFRISLKNSAYGSYQRRIDEVHIIGRMVWFARRL